MTLKVNNNRSTEDKKKDLKNKLSQSIENTGDLLGLTSEIFGIPGINNIAPKLSKEISKKINKDEKNYYFVTQSSCIWETILNRATKILKNKDLMKKYNYNYEDLEIKIEEYILDDNWENIENYLEISFLDDPSPEFRHPYYTISIQFEELFKQINFEDMKLYSACEIVTHGGHPDRIRDYYMLSSHIKTELCNQ